MPWKVYEMLPKKATRPSHLAQETSRGMFVLFFAGTRT